MSLATPLGWSSVVWRVLRAALGLPIGASRWLNLRRQYLRQPLEVEDPANQVRLLPDPCETPPTETPEPVPVLALAEEFLNLLPRSLRELIAEAPHPHPDARMRGPAPAAIRCKVGGDAERQQGVDEPRGEVTLVAP